MTRVQPVWTDEDRASWRYRWDLRDLRGICSGMDAVIVACGPSACSAMVEYADYWTICCNRAVEFGVPDFAACFEPRKDVGVWDVVKEVHPEPLILSHIPRDHGRVVLTGSKDDASAWIDDEERGLSLGQSTFFALAAALALGFDQIGIIGLDMTPDRYDRIRRTEARKAYGRLYEVAAYRGQEVINLSRESTLKVFPRKAWHTIRTKRSAFS